MSMKKTKLIIDDEDYEYDDPQPKQKPNPTSTFKKPVPIPQPNKPVPIPQFKKPNPVSPYQQQPPKQDQKKIQALGADLIKKVVQQNNGSFFNFQSITDRSKYSSEDSSYEEISNLTKNIAPDKQYQSPMLNFEDSIRESRPFFNENDKKGDISSYGGNNNILDSVQNMNIPQTTSIEPPKKKGKIKIVQDSEPTEKRWNEQSSDKYAPNNYGNAEFLSSDVSSITHKSSNSVFSLPYDNSYQNKNQKLFKKSQSQSLPLTERKDWIQEMNNPRLEWRNSKKSPLEIKIMLKILSQQTSPSTVTQLQSTQPVSQPLPLSSRFSQYPPQSEIRKWVKQFPVYRKIRGDGNCFYRAFLFSFLEMALTHKSSLYFLKFLAEMTNVNKVNFETDYGNKKITQSKSITPSSMRAFVIHRLLILYSYRVSLAENGDSKWEQKIISLLEQVFNEPPYCFDMFLIIAIKNYAIHQLQHIQQFRDFDEIDQVKQQILKYGYQCEMNQFPIRALSNGLGVCVSLYQELRGNFDFESYGDKRKEKIILYYRPGHYDLVYPHKEVYAKVVGNQ